MIKRGMNTGMVACPLVSGMNTGMKTGAAIYAKRINRAYLTGSLVGVGITVLGCYLYKKNQNKTECFLKKQGVNVKESDSVATEP